MKSVHKKNPQGHKKKCIKKNRPNETKEGTELIKIIYIHHVKSTSVKLSLFIFFLKYSKTHIIYYTIYICLKNKYLRQYNNITNKTGVLGDLCNMYSDNNTLTSSHKWEICLLKLKSVLFQFFLPKTNILQNTNVYSNIHTLLHHHKN